MLAQIRVLRVISRTSVMQYKGAAIAGLTGGLGLIALLLAAVGYGFDVSR